MVSARYARLSFCFAFGSAFTASSNLRLAWDLSQIWNKSHARRKYAEALKAIKDKEKRKGTLAYDALKQIGAVYKIDNELAGLEPAERQHRRQLEVKPLVDAYFAWVKEHQDEVLPKSQTGAAFSYSLNQEGFLRVFLKDGEVPPGQQRNRIHAAGLLHRKTQLAPDRHRPRGEIQRHHLQHH